MVLSAEGTDLSLFALDAMHTIAHPAFVCLADRSEMSLHLCNGESFQVRKISAQESVDFDDIEMSAGPSRESHGDVAKHQTIARQRARAASATASAIFGDFLEGTEVVDAQPASRWCRNGALASAELTINVPHVPSWPTSSPSDALQITKFTC
ncbi:hypothetical protein ABIF86_000588 [Bradyrhizobium japonicum]